MMNTAVVAPLLAPPKGQSVGLSKERSDDSNQTGAPQGTHNPRTAKANSTLNLTASGSKMGVSAGISITNWQCRHEGIEGHVVTMAQLADRT